MSRIMEEIVEEEIREAKYETALKTFQTGKLSVREIADCLRLPIDEVRKITDK